MIKPGTLCIVRTDQDTDAAPYNGLIVTVVSGPRMATRQRPPFDEVPVYEIAPPIRPDLRYVAARALVPIEPDYYVIAAYMREAAHRRDVERRKNYPPAFPPWIPPKR